jgi:hypothetical protein
LDSYYKYLASEKQGNASLFGDLVGDDESDTTTKKSCQRKQISNHIKPPAWMKQLKSWFNSEESNFMEALLSGRETILEDADVAFFLADNSGELTNFYEAYNYTEPDARVKHLVTICK